MSIKRYGKSISSLLLQKKSFFKENDLHVKKQRKIGSIYKKQQKRINCKNCNTKLNSITDFDFIKDGIEYVFCNHCNHLNGMYEDSNEFCKAIYEEKTGKHFDKDYIVDDMGEYDYRVATIYLPKVEFMYTSFLENNVNPHNLKYLDFGCGSGYFVAGLKKVGLNNVSGTDPSKSLVNFGNKMIGENLLTVHKLEYTYKTLRETNSQVVSMIGVLEHLQHPREALNELKYNDNVKFLYISVPMFSPSVYLEIFSPEIFHRQLSEGHTHLFTEKSLAHLCEEFGFEVIAEWWFGTDMVDLFRHIAVSLKKQKSSEKLMELWRQYFIPIIDAMQLEIDKKHLSSEVHMVLRKVQQC